MWTPKQPSTHLAPSKQRNTVIRGLGKVMVDKDTFKRLHKAVSYKLELLIDDPSTWLGNNSILLRFLSLEVERNLCHYSTLRLAYVQRPWVMKMSCFKPEPLYGADSPLGSSTPLRALNSLWHIFLVWYILITDSESQVSRYNVLLWGPPLLCEKVLQWHPFCCMRQPFWAYVPISSWMFVVYTCYLEQSDCWGWPKSAPGSLTRYLRTICKTFNSLLGWVLGRWSGVMLIQSS